MAKKVTSGEDFSFYSLPKQIFKIPNFHARYLSTMNRENAIDGFSAVKHAAIICGSIFLKYLNNKVLISGSQKKAAGKKVPTGFIKEETELSFAQIDRAVLTVKPSDIAIIKKLIPEIPVGQSRSVIEGIFKARPDVLGLEREVICVALTTLLGKVPSVKKGLTSEEKKLLPELIERISDIETAATEAEDEDESEEGVEGEEDAELDDDDAAPIDEEEEEDGPVAEDGAVSEEERDSDSSFNEDTMSLIPVIDDPAQLGNWGQIERRPTSQVFFKLTSRSLYGYGVRPNGKQLQILGNIYFISILFRCQGLRRGRQVDQRRSHWSQPARVHQGVSEY